MLNVNLINKANEMKQGELYKNNKGDKKVNHTQLTKNLTLETTNKIVHS